MLDALRQIHEELNAALLQLENVANKAAPDESALAQARLQLSRTSGRRRRLIDAICNRLLSAAPPGDADRIRALRDRNATQLHASTGHIGKWGLREIIADWPGYQQASAAMRQSIRDLIRDDRQTLYPLLQRLGG
jgi:hypothetical protein